MPRDPRPASVSAGAAARARRAARRCRAARVDAQVQGRAHRPDARRRAGPAAGRRMRRRAQPACDGAVARRRRGAWPRTRRCPTLAGDPARSRLAITLDPKDGSPLYQGIVALEAASIAALIEHYLDDVGADRQPDGAGHGRRARARDPAPAAARRRTRRRSGVAARGRGRWRCSTAPTCSGRRAPKRCSPRASPRTTSGCSRRDRRASAATAPTSGSPTRCACSAAAEVESILAEQGMVGVTCEFCNRSYHFVAADALALFTPPGNRGSTRRRTPCATSANRRVPGRAAHEPLCPRAFPDRRPDGLRAAGARSSVRDAGDARRAGAAGHAPAVDPCPRSRAATARCSAISRGRTRTRAPRRRGIRWRSSTARTPTSRRPGTRIRPARCRRGTTPSCTRTATIELAQDGAETRAILDLLIQRFESGRAAPWQLALDPPATARDGRRDHRLSPQGQAGRRQAQAVAEPQRRGSQPRRGRPRRRRLCRRRGDGGVDAGSGVHGSE